MSLLGKPNSIFSELSSADFWRRHGIAIGYVVFGVILFAVFLFSNFPYGQALTSMLAPLNIDFSYSGQSSEFPIGALLEGVRIGDALHPNAPAIVDNASVRLSPSLTSILLTQPKLNLSAEMYGGVVDAAVRRDGDAIDLALDVNNLELARYEPLVKMGVNAQGAISGSGGAKLTNGDILRDSGQVSLAIRDLTLRLARELPSIRLGNVTGTAHLSHGTLEITELKSHGTDVNIEARGSIQLAADLGKSRLNLRLTVTPTEAGRNRLGFLLAMLPHPPNGRPYFLRGPLNAPSIT